MLRCRSESRFTLRRTAQRRRRRRQAGGGEGAGDELEAGADHVTGSACRCARCEATQMRGRDEGPWGGEQGGRGAERRGEERA